MIAKLDETDKTLGLIVNFLVVLMLVVALIVFHLVGPNAGMLVAIAAVSWWFGATMSWAIGKVVHLKRK